MQSSRERTQTPVWEGGNTESTEKGEKKTTEGKSASTEEEWKMELDAWTGTMRLTLALCGVSGSAVR